MLKTRKKRGAGAGMHWTLKSAGQKGLTRTNGRESRQDLGISPRSLTAKAKAGVGTKLNQVAAENTKTKDMGQGTRDHFWGQNAFKKETEVGEVILT